MFLVKFFTLVIGTLTSFVVLYIILATYTQSGNYLASENTYYMLILIQSHLSATLTRLLPNALLQGAETLSAIKRIESIVKKMETEMKHTTDFEKVPRIFLKDVCVSVKDMEILQEIDLKVEQGLIVVTGPIGSGKSTLLKTILQDYRPDKGDLKVQGTVSYASQEPWLFPSTIKQNILFGQKCDEQRYQQVLKICALLFDLEMLQDGDSTMVEDRGTNLSRGQQARINLARAVYNQSDIYILDDPLAGLDAHVGAFVFEECIKQFLKDKLVLLVTHNQSNAKDADRVVRIEGGKLESAGNLSVTTDTFCDGITGRQTEQALSNGSNEEDGTTDEGSKLIANNIENKNLYHERRNSGGVKWKVYRKYLAFGGGGFVFSLVFATYLLSQFVMSLKDKLLSDW
jgi:ATP-binding cassette subfamily C (CFTR/MRP) protein 4